MGCGVCVVLSHVCISRGEGESKGFKTLVVCISRGEGESKGGPKE